MTPAMCTACNSMIFFSCHVGHDIMSSVPSSFSVKKYELIHILISATHLGACDRRSDVHPERLQRDVNVGVIW